MRDEWGKREFLTINWKTIMKNNYLNFADDEITIYCGTNAKTNCEASLRQAEAIARTRKQTKTLYINTFLSTRKIMAATRLAMPKTEANILFENVEIGELANAIWDIKRKIEDQKIKYVIINSWEFAHRSYTYKEQAIFALMGMINSLGITVLVYSQAKPAEAGKIQRGGLGKLSALANEIVTLEIEENSTEKEILEVQIEKLSPKKINELDYAHSESGISSGGILIIPNNEAVHRVLERELLAA